MDGERASATPRPARAISSSRPGAFPPLTPIPPTVAPPIRIGQPPAAMINLPSVIVAMLEAKPGMPDAHCATASVDWLNITAVHALAILMLPVAQPYGAIMRSKSTRWPPASTMAILTGLRNSLARCLLASNILRAISTDRFMHVTPFYEGETHIFRIYSRKAPPNNFSIKLDECFCKYSVLYISVQALPTYSKILIM